MARTIKKTNPKGSDIQVSEDGLGYHCDLFSIHFQNGPIHRHGVRNGAFDEDLLKILIDRAEQGDDPEYADHLKQALALHLGVDESEDAEASPASTDKSATATP